MSRILVIDDDENIRHFLKRHLERIGYEAATAPNGRLGIDAALRSMPALVLLDVDMPVMDGIETLKEFKSNEDLRAVPVIMITSYGEKKDVLTALKHGANDYVVKPFDIDVLLHKLKGWLNSAVENQWGDVNPAVGQSLRLVKAAMDAAFAAARKSEALPIDEIRKAVETLREAVETAGAPGILRAVKTYKPNLFLHSLLVCTYLMLLSKSRGDAGDAAVTLGMGGLLHDIGSVLLPEIVSSRPDKLKFGEFEKTRRHVEQGISIMEKNPNVPQVVKDICRLHHERLDGSGFPQGIKGDAISVEARMTAVVENFTALTDNAVNRDAIEIKMACIEMQSHEGQYDPKILSGFAEAVTKVFASLGDR
jgi:response regulator RpfG family c-di-GMP phosphodiesterase